VLCSRSVVSNPFPFMNPSNRSSSRQRLEMFIKHPRPHALVVLLASCIFGALMFCQLGRRHWASVIHQSPLVTASPSSRPECLRLLPASEMLIVIKTGATEIDRKLSVHFSTTLRCIPHFVILSDMAQEFQGYPVHDILDSISLDTRETHEDFIFYRKLQEYQTLGRNVSDLIDDNHDTAWNLDKWKFLPMMGKALQSRPTAKWYFFIETDTAVVWDNLFEFLSRLDPAKPWYIGAPAFLADIAFAHGGTGFVMSNRVVRLVADKWANHQKEMEALVAEEWAGDFVLAKVLKSLGVGIRGSWPVFQGETPATLDYTSADWCYPVVTYHHVDAEWVKNISDFQNDWARTGITVGDNLSRQ
jgi:hypothetical protein